MEPPVMPKNEKGPPERVEILFVIEEYKALQEKVKNARDIVTRYETVTMGGVVVAPAVLLGLGVAPSGTAAPHNISIAWWGLDILLVFVAVRCWAYYLYIGGLQDYVAKIEGYVRYYGYELSGFETAKRKQFFGILTGYIANFVIWFGMISIVSLLAFIKGGNPFR
jgi:hypothetical protein